MGSDDHILMETAQHGSVLLGVTIEQLSIVGFNATPRPPRRPRSRSKWAGRLTRYSSASALVENLLGENDDVLEFVLGRTACLLCLVYPPLHPLRRKLEFPICTLGSRPKKNDVNGNFDPVFTIVGWAPRSDFEAILPPADQPPPSSGSAAPVDDDAPF